ncbi:hypothetical protein BU26DRAFT_238123 [Trematosphaeria pertusa]|uniref:Uncharacterized protein n=1 Tax=Trematosphaeria pertusa TaxID=390896 RepID=A0A6A6HQK4_9PLEO|nr:uncharacterized protein BU26DRAFT_238123 [Trematosphaeria pertusa]KAF2240301.1 hypothetical protein BU26DRAFT_238123 [Trematosphaeria pertusa]
MGAANLGKHGRWKAFWRVYAVLAPTLDDFINDYCEAWKLRHTIDKEVIIFIDNDHRLAIPCSGTMDDKALVRHIRVFYNLARARVGIFEFFGAKSTLRIDVVKLEQHFAVGARVGPPLGLGRHGPFSRLVHYLKDPSKMSGTDLVQRLETEAVLTPPGQQTCALNIVRSWDPYITSTIILIPVVLSFIVSVLWSVIAAAYFKADVNASTQTAFTIGSYVVTAGRATHRPGGIPREQVCRQ